MNTVATATPLELDIARLERRYYTRFWGRKRLVRPKFVKAVLGDGRQLLALTPGNTRPNYYYIRVDSAWATSNYSDEENIADHLDEILDAVQEEHGPYSDDERLGWPALNWDAGVSWCQVDPLDYLPTKV